MVSDSDYGVLEETDIEKLASILPPEKQAEGRKILKKEYQRQQSSKSQK